MVKSVWKTADKANRKRRFIFPLGLASVFLILIGCVDFAHAGAGLFIDKTRIVFPSSAKEQTVIVHNENDYPVMVQVWIDDGDIDADLSSLKTPLLAVPPLFKLQPNEGKSIKIVNAARLKELDRERIFWFNAQMIPPVQPDKPNNLTVSVRTRLKVFYRPDSLTSGGSARWIESITCSLEVKETVYVECRNPSPYFATIDKIELSFNSNRKPIVVNGTMIEPYGSIRQIVSSAKGVKQLSLFLINDDGYIENKVISAN